VAPAPRTPDPLFATRWIHAFEEDTNEAWVFRPESADFPLTRRPREALELAADGSALVLLPGPSDRPRPAKARWQREGGQVVVRTEGEPGTQRMELHILSCAADRLVARP
jgi:hypothetical protein